MNDAALDRQIGGKLFLFSPFLSFPSISRLLFVEYSLGNLILRGPDITMDLLMDVGVY